jgi:hypothetical protein
LADLLIDEMASPAMPRRTRRERKPIEAVMLSLFHRSGMALAFPRPIIREWKDFI